MFFFAQRAESEGKLFTIVLKSKDCLGGLGHGSSMCQYRCQTECQDDHFAGPIHRRKYRYHLEGCGGCSAPPLSSNGWSLLIQTGKKESQGASKDA